MSMESTKLTESEVIKFLRRLVDEGSTLYDADVQLKDPSGSYEQDLDVGLTEFQQIFLTNRIFTKERMILKEVDNIHSGKIWMIDRKFPEGFITILIAREGDGYEFVISNQRLFSSHFKLYFDPSPELIKYKNRIKGFLKRIKVKKRSRARAA